jgi:hypothetical protein
LRGLQKDNKATEDLDDDGMSDDDVATTTMTMINETSTTTTTQQQQQQGLVDLVHLIPFNVQIAVTINMGIQTYEVLNIVTDFFNEAYKEQLIIFGYTKENQYAEFNSVVLFDNSPQQQRQRERDMQSNSNSNLFEAKFRGGAVFTRGTNHSLSIPENDVWVIQQNVLLDDNGLLTLLQQSTEATGLGEFVIDVNAFLNPTVTNDPNSKDDDAGNNTSSSKTGLDVVIIVAIVIAVIAFLFLLGAIIWAYRFDRANHESYLSSTSLKDQHTTMGGSSYMRRLCSNISSSSNNNDNNNLTSSNLNDKTTSETETVNDPDTPERIHRSTIVIEGSPNSVDNDTSIPNIHQSSDLHVAVYPTMISGKDSLPPPMSDVLNRHDDDDENYPESVISDSVVSGSAISEDISTSLSQYYRAGMGKADLYGRSNGMLSDAGSVSSMESYGYSLDGGMSMAIPTEIPYQQQRENRQRIGGLPVEPVVIAATNSRDGSIFDERSMDDVQILDLDKELSNLDIKLLPRYSNDENDVDGKNDTYTDLEKYQLEDLKEIAQLNSNGIPTVVSTTSSTASKASSKKTTSSKASSSKKSITVPIDTDSMIGTPDSDDDDNFNEDVLPKFSTEKIF